ncbi:DUF3157 family protein [Vibrio navarrensis]|uniref:DUF3157 family protein n=1 Tax=Vibrio navarrensis TaxID=29495 RepID=A0AAI9CXQ8_9VIBR|nr:DUF3157 family protein [Vibrio navarrensis]EJL6396205.1 DUF3157 family protein [Vibrio navarrensis]EKA5636915.1 DUF3157 family protein [Vibrio navarrensis]ELN6934232.1 DUF3157 family protein [Vibrio navarrensis]
MKLWTTALMLLSGASYAGQVITLPDGRQAELNDDFTWRYLLPELSEKTPQPMQLRKPLLAGVTITPGNGKPVLQLSHSGVDVLLRAAEYQDGELLIPLSVANQSTQSVITVAVELTITDLDGEILYHDNVVVWQSIKRLAETYLRPQQLAQGKTIKIALPPHAQYQLQANIVQIDSR